MTKASQILKSILGEAYSSPVPAPVGTQGASDYIPNPNDVKGMHNSMDIEDQGPLAKKLGAIIDSLDDDDITEDLADIVEKYLEDVDSAGNMTVADAAMMLPLEDCQDLYEELTGYLTRNGIDYSEDDVDSSGMPNEIPADIYPSSSNMIMGGVSDAPMGSRNIGN